MSVTMEPEAVELHAQLGHAPLRLLREAAAPAPRAPSASGAARSW